MSRYRDDSGIGFDCGKCQAVEGLQEFRGCEKDGHVKWAGGSLRCPKAQLICDPDVADYYSIAQFYNLKRQGFLPHSIGYLEHPAIAIDLVELLERELFEIEERMEEERRAKEKAAAAVPVIRTV